MKTKEDDDWFGEGERVGRRGGINLEGALLAWRLVTFWRKGTIPHLSAKAM